MPMLVGLNGGSENDPHARHGKLSWQCAAMFMMPCCLFLLFVAIAYFNMHVPAIDKLRPVCPDRSLNVLSDRAADVMTGAVVAATRLWRRSLVSVSQLLLEMTMPCLSVVQEAEGDFVDFICGAVIDILCFYMRVPAVLQRAKSPKLQDELDRTQIYRTAHLIVALVAHLVLIACACVAWRIGTTGHSVTWIIAFVSYSHGHIDTGDALQIAIDHTIYDNVCLDGPGNCIACGMRDCPHGEPMHHHHHGCPSCVRHARPRAA